MYVPENNRVEDRAQRIAFIREYNFAALVTGGAANGLRATHLPFILGQQPERGHAAVGADLMRRAVLQRRRVVRPTIRMTADPVRWHGARER
ncbi:MAG: FMN-binding negative transcriptional regulator [Nevskia sp.]|nr:FMN-binding negative transcriptional regulator [Nevskia sp.]